MKKITILSVFPKLIEDALSYGIIKRASVDIKIDSLGLREWGIGTHQRIDDESVAPGPGMLLRADVVTKALLDVKKNQNNSFVIHVSPRGIPLTSQKAKELSEYQNIIIVASRYEGLDQRVIDNHIDLEISIGDYILSGGELAVLVLIDAILRMTGKVLRMDAVLEESFQQGLLEYSHYTKPIEYENQKIPEYLLSGNHKVIEQTRFIEQLYITWLRRPDLFREYPVCDMNVNNKNPLTKIKKENKLLQERLYQLEKAIRENKKCPKS